MRFDRFDLNLLVALDVLLEEKSVSAAARRLHLSQPAITGALNRLRDYFEDDILVQSGRRMLLTPKAEELSEPVRRALMQIRSEITRPGPFDPATAVRRFSLVASDYAYAILVADMIVAAAQDAPGVTFEIIPPSGRAVELLQRAEIDLFVTVSQFTFGPHPQLPLFRDEEVVISWSGAKYDKMDEETFFSAGHAVALFGADRQPTIADRYLTDAGHERQIEVIVPNFGALPQAVLGTRRLATLHRLYAEHFARTYPITIHPSPIDFPEIVEVAQWHRMRERDPGLQWLLQLLQAQRDKLPAGAQIAPPSP